MSSNRSQEVAIKNEGIEINQVKNGFVVSSSYRDHMAQPLNYSHVFQSMSELVGFIQGHFDHRAERITNDND